MTPQTHKNIHNLFVQKLRRNSGKEKGYQASTYTWLKAAKTEIKTGQKGQRNPAAQGHTGSTQV